MCLTCQIYLWNNSSFQVSQWNNIWAFICCYVKTFKGIFSSYHHGEVEGCFIKVWDGSAGCFLFYTDLWEGRCAYFRGTQTRYSVKEQGIGEAFSMSDFCFNVSVPVHLSQKPLEQLIYSGCPQTTSTAHQILPLLHISSWISSSQVENVHLLKSSSQTIHRRSFSRLSTHLHYLQESFKRAHHATSHTFYLHIQ